MPTKCKPSSMNGLTCTELVEIIEACGRNSVYTLTLPDGTRLNFMPEAEKKSFVEASQQVIKGTIDTFVNTPLESLDEVAHNKEDDIVAGMETIDQDMFDLMLTDPEAYEKLQISGDI